MARSGRISRVRAAFCSPSPRARPSRQAKEPGSTGQLDDMSVVIVLVRERTNNERRISLMQGK